LEDEYEYGEDEDEENYAPPAQTKKDNSPAKKVVAY